RRSADRGSTVDRRHLRRGPSAVVAAGFHALPRGGGGARHVCPAAHAGAPAAAVDRRAALLLLLAAAVARGHAEVAMIHELNNDGAVAVSAHGPQVFEALGMRTKLLDPALVAAAGGMR